MPEHIGAELQFEAVDRFEAPAGRHDARIVDEDVERPALREFAIAKGAHRSKACEIQSLKPQSGGGQFSLQTGEGIGAALFVTAGEHDLRAFASQYCSGVIANAAVGPGDDDALAVLRRDVGDAPLFVLVHWRLSREGR
ncbi:hypothetical protein QFZ98_004265 [Paraburkholderia youngii]